MDARARPPDGKRRALPWVRLEKNYVFEGAGGRRLTLADLFDGRSQLVVYHFMFGPEWEEGCPGCSLLSDQVDGARQHFEHNDVSFVAVSRAPIASSRPIARAWAGHSAGLPPEATSTSTITSRSRTARAREACSTISSNRTIRRWTSFRA